MTDTERRRKPESRPTAWVLAAPGAGDNGQLRTLVDLLDADACWLDEIDSVRRVLRDRLVSFRARDIPSDKRSTYAPPWPDLVLIAGGRAVIDARRIRYASGGRTRVICLGRPWAPLHWFDLIVTTPQYRLPTAPNLVTLDLPLNLPPALTEDALAYWKPRFDKLPRPILGVLLGGDSGSYRFDAASAAAIARRVNALAGRAGGSAVVVGSPRTPPEAIRRIEQDINVPARVYAWSADAHNPYGALLRLAEAFLVTGDSASMLAEACYTGKPVALAELRERLRSSLNRKVRASMPALTRATEQLTARGLWIPARDMPALHERAAASGRLAELTSLRAPSSRSSVLDDSPAEIRERVYAMLES